MYDVEAIRKEFPILSRKINGKPLAYLDNAATTQKPDAVLKAVSEYYRNSNANVHRSVSTLAEEATEAFEQSRKTVAGFVGGKVGETIFTRNATESLNLVAQSWGRENLEKKDAVVLTEMDHHSNLVPWQQVALKKGAELVFVPVTKAGELDENFEFPVNAKVFAFPQVSNALGTVNDMSWWAKKAKKAGATVVVDGAAGAPHGLGRVGGDMDFYAFSGHKMCGPMGSGVLWGKKEFLEKMPPFLYGGSMIAGVKKTETRWAKLPAKFEAGTPDVGAAVGLAEAIRYLEKIGFAQIRRHEQTLLKAALDLLAEIPSVRVYSNAAERVATVSFNVNGVHAHDGDSILDSEGIAIRSGHHCCQVLMDALKVPATARASFYLYNTLEEVQRLADGVKKIKKIFGVK